jgi:ATP-binding cassette, subfamily B, bacterial MsbA
VKLLNLTHLRREILGYVNQEPVLFNQSIKENMLLAKPDATDQEIIEALKATNAWEFVS